MLMQILFPFFFKFRNIEYYVNAKIVAMIYARFHAIYKYLRIIHFNRCIKGLN